MYDESGHYNRCEPRGTIGEYCYSNLGDYDYQKLQEWAQNIVHRIVPQVLTAALG